MTAEALHLRNAPIIEAVVDIHCDLPPGLDLAAMQDRAKQVFLESYSKARRQMTQRREVGGDVERPAEVAVRQVVNGLLFLTEDDKQIVQIRPEGYTLNRLAPYGSLDEYLPDIEWSWSRFRELTHPVQIRGIGLRYINRILLPMADGQIDLPAYLNVTPYVPDRGTLQFMGFLNQSSAVEMETGNHAKITLATQPVEEARLPIVFDIEVSDPSVRSPEAWQDVREAIDSLRRLKNRVFERTLTEKCLNLFRQP